MEKPRTMQEKIELAKKIAFANSGREASSLKKMLLEEIGKKGAVIEPRVVRKNIKEEQEEENNKYLTYKIPSYFLTASSSDARLKLIACPNRVGKSTWMVFEAFWCAMNCHPHKKFIVPNSSWLIGPTLAHVQEVLLDEMRRWGLDQFWRKYEARTGKITWKSGSTTYVKSYDNRKNLQGRALRRIFMDEEVPDDIWHELMMRCSADQPLDLLVAATPIACEEWFCDLCDRGEAGEKDIFIAPPITIWDAAQSAGGHLSDENINTISKLCTDENERNVRLYGRRVKRASQVLPLDEKIHKFSPESRIDWVGNRPPQGWVKAMGHDPHPRKPASVVWIAFDPVNGDGYVYDYREINDPISEQVRVLRDINEKQEIFALFMDPAASGCMSSNSIYEGWNYYSEFCAQYPQIPVILSKKERQMVIASIKNRLLYDYTKPIGLGNKPQLYISDKLEEFWNLLKKVRYREYRDRRLQGVNQKAEIGKDDAMMALGYVLVMIPQYLHQGILEEYRPQYDDNEPSEPEMGY